MIEQYTESFNFTCELGRTTNVQPKWKCYPLNNLVQLLQTILLRSLYHNIFLGNTYLLNVYWVKLRNVDNKDSCFYKIEFMTLYYINHVVRPIPYRNLNYKAQKFAMVLSSLDIHGLNVSRST